jgi:hypothetical protein
MHSSGLQQMTAGLPFLREVIVDELAVAHLAEAGEVAAMHDRDIEIAHAQQRCDVIIDKRMIGIVDQRAVLGLRAAIRRQNRILVAAIAV